MYQEAQVNQTLLVFGVKYLLFSLPLLERNLYCVCYVWRVDLKKKKIKNKNKRGGEEKRQPAMDARALRKACYFCASCIVVAARLPFLHH